MSNTHYGDEKFKVKEHMDKLSGEYLPTLYRRNAGRSLTAVATVVKHKTGYAVMANNFLTAITGKKDMRFSFPTVREAKDTMWKFRDDFKVKIPGTDPTPKEVHFAAE